LNRSQACCCYELLAEAWELVLDYEAFWGTMRNMADSELQPSKKEAFPASLASVQAASTQLQSYEL